MIKIHIKFIALASLLGFSSLLLGSATKELLKDSIVLKNQTHIQELDITLYPREEEGRKKAEVSFNQPLILRRSENRMIEIAIPWIYNIKHQCYTPLIINVDNLPKSSIVGLQLTIKQDPNFMSGLTYEIKGAAKEKMEKKSSAEAELKKATCH